MKPKIVEIDGTQRKLNKVIGKDEVDTHHIIGRRYREKYNTNIKENLKKIPRRLHVALNSFFGDKQNPRDQLKQVFELVKPVLSEGVRRELYTILYDADDDLFYIPEVLKGKKGKKGTNTQTKESADTDSK